MYFDIVMTPVVQSEADVAFLVVIFQTKSNVLFPL